VTSFSQNARVAALLWILASVVGGMRLIYVPKALFVHGSAAATASNIAAHESLFRFGIVCYLVAAVLFLFVILTLYRLLKDVDPMLAALMAILGGLITPIFVVNTVTDVGALLFARGTEYLSVIDAQQRVAFVRMFLDLHSNLDLANEVFWGSWLFPFGVLLYKSGFVPRLLGVWAILGGAAWLADCFTGFLFPAYHNKVFLYGQVFMQGELVTMFWLMIIGVKQRRLPAAT
jgi:Domain of unknown function (DUF4386)